MAGNSFRKKQGQNPADDFGDIFEWSASVPASSTAVAGTGGRQIPLQQERDVREEYVFEPTFESAGDKLELARQCRRAICHLFDRTKTDGSWDEKKCIGLLSEMGYGNPEGLFRSYQLSNFEDRLGAAVNAVAGCAALASASDNAAFRHDKALEANLRASAILAEFTPFILRETQEGNLMAHGLKNTAASPFDYARDAQCHLAHYNMSMFLNARSGDGSFKFKRSQLLDDAYSAILPSSYSYAYGHDMAGTYGKILGEYVETFNGLSRRQAIKFEQGGELAKLHGPDRLYFQLGPYVEASVPLAMAFLMMTPGGVPLGSFYFGAQAKGAFEGGDALTGVLMSLTLLAPVFGAAAGGGGALAGAGRVGLGASALSGRLFQLKIAGGALTTLVAADKYGFTDADIAALGQAAGFAVMPFAAGKAGKAIAGQPQERLMIDVAALMGKAEEGAKASAGGGVSSRAGGILRKVKEAYAANQVLGIIPAVRAPKKEIAARENQADAKQPTILGAEEKLPGGQPLFTAKRLSKIAASIDLPVQEVERLAKWRGQKISIAGTDGQHYSVIRNFDGTLGVWQAEVGEKAGQGMAPPTAPSSETYVPEGAVKELLPSMTPRVALRHRIALEANLAKKEFCTQALSLIDHATMLKVIGGMDNLLGRGDLSEADMQSLGRCLETISSGRQVKIRAREVVSLCRLLENPNLPILLHAAEIALAHATGNGKQSALQALNALGKREGLSQGHIDSFENIVKNNLPAGGDEGSGLQYGLYPLLQNPNLDLSLLGQIERMRPQENIYGYSGLYGSLNTLLSNENFTPGLTKNIVHILSVEKSVYGRSRAFRELNKLLSTGASLPDASESASSETAKIIRSGGGLALEAKNSLVLRADCDGAHQALFASIGERLREGATDMKRADAAVAFYHMVLHENFRPQMLQTAENVLNGTETAAQKSGASAAEARMMQVRSMRALCSLLDSDNLGPDAVGKFEHAVSLLCGSGGKSQSSSLEEYGKLIAMPECTIEIMGLAENFVQGLEESSRQLLALRAIERLAAHPKCAPEHIGSLARTCEIVNSLPGKYRGSVLSAISNFTANSQNFEPGMLFGVEELAGQSRSSKWMLDRLWPHLAALREGGIDESEQIPSRINGKNEKGMEEMGKAQPPMPISSAPQEASQSALMRRIDAAIGTENQATGDVTAQLSATYVKGSAKAALNALLRNPDFGAQELSDFASCFEEIGGAGGDYSLRAAEELCTLAQNKRFSPQALDAAKHVCNLGESKRQAAGIIAINRLISQRKYSDGHLESLNSIYSIAEERGGANQEKIMGMLDAFILSRAFEPDYLFDIEGRLGKAIGGDDMERKLTAMVQSYMRIAGMEKSTATTGKPGADEE